MIPLQSGREHRYRTPTRTGCWMEVRLRVLCPALTRGFCGRRCESSLRNLKRCALYRPGPGVATVHFTLSLVETRTGLDSGHDDDLCRNPIKWLWRLPINSLRGGTYCNDPRFWRSAGPEKARGRKGPHADVAPRVCTCVVLARAGLHCSNSPETVAVASGLRKVDTKTYH